MEFSSFHWLETIVLLDRPRGHWEPLVPIISGGIQTERSRRSIPSANAACCIGKDLSARMKRTIRLFFSSWALLVRVPGRGERNENAFETANKNEHSFGKERTCCKTSIKNVPSVSFGTSRPNRTRAFWTARNFPNETLGTIFMLVYSVFALYRTNVRFCSLFRTRFHSVRLDLGYWSRRRSSTIVIGFVCPWKTTAQKCDEECAVDCGLSQILKALEEIRSLDKHSFLSNIPLGNSWSTRTRHWFDRFRSSSTQFRNRSIHSEESIHFSKTACQWAKVEGISPLSKW